MHPLVPVVVLLSASVLWGFTWLPLKHFGSYGVMGPLVTLLAHGSLGVLALPLLLSRRSQWRKHWRAMLALVLFGGCANVTFASAMLAGDVTRVMVLFYLLPAWGVLGARFWLREKIDGRRRLSLALALLGAFCILGGTKMFESPPGFLDFVAVVAGLALALTNLVFRKEQQLSVSNKVSATFVGCLVWAGALVLFEGSIPSGVPALVWTQVVGFGLVWILLATAGTLWGVHHMEAGRSSVLLVMELVTAVLSAAWFSGELGTPLEWAGGGLILASALLEGWPAKRPMP